MTLEKYVIALKIETLDTSAMRLAQSLSVSLMQLEWLAYLHR